MANNIRCRWLMYAALFTLSIVNLKFEAVSFIDGNSPSLFLCMLFILVNFDYVIRRRQILKGELIFLVCLTLSIVLSLSMNTDGTGLIRNINGYAGFIICYVAFRTWFLHITEYRKNKTIKSLFWGYVICSGSMGLLQLIYIYFGKSQTLHSLFNLLLSRGIEGYLDASIGRIQFWGEPSYAGTFLFLAFIPAYLYVRKIGLVNRTKADVIFIAMLLLNLLTFSARLVIDTGVFIIAVIICKWISKRSKKNLLGLFILVLGILILVVFRESIGLLLMSSSNSALNRIGKIMYYMNVGDTDSSMAIRYEKIRCAFLGFFQKPVWGWGVGNYIGALRQNINFDMFSTWNSLNEMKNTINSGYSSTYSFYATSLCESGFCGIGMIMCILNRIVLTIKRNKSNRYILLVAIYICYIFFQSELAGFYLGAFWLAMFATRKEKLLFGDEHEPSSC